MHAFVLASNADASANLERVGEKLRASHIPALSFKFIKLGAGHQCASGHTAAGAGMHVQYLSRRGGRVRLLLYLYCVHMATAGMSSYT